MKRIYAQESVCIGCRLCEVYCIAAHSPGGNLVKAFRQTQRPVAAVRVQEDGALSFAMQCRHCDEPACLAACITGALEHDERGVVTVNAEKCIGCWTCILACPYGAISRNEARRQSVKCDLCPGQDVPKCVAMCPNGALHYTETPPAFLVPKVG